MQLKKWEIIVENFVIKCEFKLSGMENIVFSGEIEAIGSGGLKVKSIERSSHV